MEFTIKEIRSSEVDVLIHGTKETVIFEKGEELESLEYSGVYAMNGYVDDVLKYGAYGTYEYGSDDFLDFEDVELV